MKTVKIKGNKSQGGFVIINEEDFDGDEHELYTGKAISEKPSAPVSYAKMNKEQLADLLNERDIEFDLSDLKADLLTLLEDADKAKEEDQED